MLLKNQQMQKQLIAKLPWNKEINVSGPYEMSVTEMTWDKSGKKGEKLTIKMCADGKEVKSNVATAGADGDLMSYIIQYSGGK